MPEIIQYELVEELGDKYRKFGICLLNDKTGAHIKAIEQEKMKNAEEINIQIKNGYKEGGKTLCSGKLLFLYWKNANSTNSQSR